MRGVYEKVEQRIAYGDKNTGHDFKRAWRVRRAKKELVTRFGLVYIRRVVVYAVVVMLVLITLIVVEAAGHTQVFRDVYESVVSSIDRIIGAIAVLLATVVAIVPSFKLAFASNEESSVSRGEVIFKQASSVKDQLGFLEMVKRDLQELFDYLREFEEKLETKIVIVPIVDDLDRCITDGRNVKVLEAMQLILSVPGAPILSFLAVDSRIVVASIEDHYEKVFSKTNISGHEYLDKIVQLPFALPEPQPEKVERLVSKTLEGDAASPQQVAQRLKVFGTRGRQILDQAGSKRVTFKVAATRASPNGVDVDLEPLVVAIQSQGLELDPKLAIELVCAAAQKLGPSLNKLADRLMDKGTRQGKVYNMNEEEVLEILCRETNVALEDGNLSFEELYIVDTNLFDLSIYL